MMSVKVKGNLRTTINLIEGQKTALEGKTDFYLKIAQLVNSSIQRRVQKDGIGTNGKKLSPYSDKYAQFKASKGRNTKFRDLTFSGNMWQSLTSENISGGARMFFNSAENVNKARGNEARTPFFGIGKKEKDIIEKQISNLLKGVS